MRQALVSLFVLMSLIPVWLVVSDWYSTVWFFQCFLTIVLVVLAKKLGTKREPNSVVLLEDNGQWSQLDNDSSGLWEVSSGSRASAIMLWIELSSKNLSGKAKKKWLWIFYDAVSPADYRRISRIVVRRQEMMKDEASHYG